MILPFCVYVLYSQKDYLLYHGFSANLVARILDHNAGMTKSSRKRRPLKLIYCEFFQTEKDAIRREAYFKTNQGKHILKLILRESLKDIQNSTP